MYAVLGNIQRLLKPMGLTGLAAVSALFAATVLTYFAAL